MKKEIIVVDFKTQILDEFKPLIVDIPKVVEESRGLTIKGVDDGVGYTNVYNALRKLQKARTSLTDFAKEKRDEYTAKNREIREVEKKYLNFILEVEDDLKEKRRIIDEQKKKEERKEFLPERKRKLKSIEIEISEDEILSMDDKQFESFFSSEKMKYLEIKNQERIAEETMKQRENEIKEAEARAEARAKERAEIEKQEAIDKFKRESEEKERLKIEEENRKVEEEKLERIKAEKNKKYKIWIDTLPKDVKIERQGDIFTAWQKVGEITIK